MKLSRAPLEMHLSRQPAQRVDGMEAPPNPECCCRSGRPSASCILGAGHSCGHLRTLSRQTRCPAPAPQEAWRRRSRQFSETSPRSSRRGLRVQLIMRRFAAHLFPLAASCAYRKSVPLHPHRNAKLDFTRRVEPRFTSVLDPLRERSEALGAANAVTFLPSGKGSCRQSLTYADLAGRAQSVATALMQRTRPGDRVLLAMDSGLAFAPSFFGCLIARRIAVPFWAAGGGRVQERFARVLDDAAASAVLVDGAGDAEAMRQAFPGLLVIDACSVPTAVVGWDSPNPDDVALLQYTSGTTGEPKGICITHGNLAANQAALELAVGDAHGQRILSWLPLNHNMGLMAGLLQPIWQGLESILMRPVHFAQNP